jgi:hypothetical protein
MMIATTVVNAMTLNIRITLSPDSAAIVAPLTITTARNVSSIVVGAGEPGMLATAAVTKSDHVENAVDMI